ncbi:Os09g0320801 [Oryza sativa Japonica Group]|uniref:Os09g0320801 protein n=1 Tax=Oryza sativa subsp. japonica TaxID=39947 RepID=A0A0P0XL59_ORYSJ|nr:Os09g0320801 [Oryza sativa Japonica Group]
MRELRPQIQLKIRLKESLRLISKPLGLTLDSDQNSALHVVAASGDSQAYVECARMVYDQARHLLGAANNNGDTPLHCAAAAGNHSSRWLLLRLRVTAAVQRGWMTRSS